MSEGPVAVSPIQGQLSQTITMKMCQKMLRWCQIKVNFTGIRPKKLIYGGVDMIKNILVIFLYRCWLLFESFRKNNFFIKKLDVFLT